MSPTFVQPLQSFFFTIAVPACLCRAAGSFFTCQVLLRPGVLYIDRPCGISEGDSFLAPTRLIALPFKGHHPFGEGSNDTRRRGHVNSAQHMELP